MENNKAAKFRFLGYKIVESSLKFNENKEPSSDTKIEFVQSHGLNQKDNKFRLVLQVNISDENESIAISVVSNGYFEFDRDLSDDEKKTFFNVNAPAILFPYLRAYVSTLTSLSGLPAITLPTVNLTAGAIE